VGPVDETNSQNQNVAPRGEIMSEAARSLSREAPAGDGIALAQPEVETFPDVACELGLGRANAVSRQRLVWRNRRFIFQATRAGILCSLLMAFLIPERFESTARLMPPEEGASGMGMAMLAAAGGNLGAQLGSGLGSLAGDLLGLKSSSDLFIGILQSRTVQDDLIAKFDLRKVYSTRRMQDARQLLAARTSLSVDRKSGILTIQVTDHDGKRAAAMAGEYAGELNRVVTQLNTSSAHRERVFLEERLTRVKQDLETAESNFSEFAAKNAALDIPAQGRAMIEAAATLEGQLIGAQTELQGLKQAYADRNVRVRSTQARVEELRQQLDKNLSGGSSGPDPADARMRQSLYPSIRELPALGVGYADLYRNTKIQEAVFQTLTQEYELAKVQEAKETPSVKILDPPDVPENKSFPPRGWIIALGALLALAGSVSWVFARQAWDRTGAEDPQKLFAQEVLHAVQARLAWAPSNGFDPSSANRSAASRFSRVEEPADGDE
jgi:uncharacterized protein involved in exopolysaccharide biosynthesis